MTKLLYQEISDLPVFKKGTKFPNFFSCQIYNKALPAASGRGIRLKYCAPRGGVLTQATQ